MLELIEMELGTFSISCHFKNYKDNFIWTFMGAYGPVLAGGREEFSNELGAIRGL